MSSKGRDLLKLSAITAAAFALGIAFASGFDLPRPGIAQQRGAVTAAAAPIQRVTGGPLPSFADVVDRVNPAVVFVSTGRRERGAQRTPQGIPPEFRDFFRFNQEPRYREGSGSGFIVSRDGYILTNNHVVADADQVTVRLLDNRVFNARVVGRDPNTDVAVIKIDATSLPTVVFGNSDQVRIGDWVLAVGNPLGFTFTVTAGIVSAKGRRLDGLVDESAQRYAIQDFIQTDAAINPGNSGGPLVNLNGEVIGINSAIASPTGTYAGYGFAVPINLARHAMDDLIATGHVTRAILGIQIREISPEDADYVGLRDIRGVVVNEFPPGSPARAAGLQPGDVIVALNDTLIDHVAQLQQMVGFKRPGESVRVTVVRKEGDRSGVRRTFDVRLVAADDDTALARSNNSADSAKTGELEGRLGVRVEPIPADFAHTARLSEDQRGVVVTDVEEGGPAWGRLVAPDRGGPDVILYVNTTRVRTPEEFQRAVRAVPRGEVVQLRVLNLNGESYQTRIVRVRSR
jgi:serine protease Do